MVAIHNSSDKFEDAVDWEKKFKDKQVKMVDEIVSLNEQLRDVQRQSEYDREAMGREKYMS